MTQEEIGRIVAVIRRAEEEIADDDLGWSYSRLAEAVPRLLGERSQLLEAAKGVLAGQSFRALYAAIEFAESDAR